LLGEKEEETCGRQTGSCGGQRISPDPRFRRGSRNYYRKNPNAGTNAGGKRKISPQYHPTGVAICLIPGSRRRGGIDRLDQFDKGRVSSYSTPVVKGKRTGKARSTTKGLSTIDDERPVDREAVSRRVGAMGQAATQNIHLGIVSKRYRGGGSKIANTHLRLWKGPDNPVESPFKPSPGRAVRSKITNPIRRKPIGPDAKLNTSPDITNGVELGAPGSQARWFLRIARSRIRADGA